MTLIQKTLHSLKWSVLGEVFSKAISPLVLIILAKILLPEDFGVVAAATVVISFSQVFWDAGLSKALIQREQRLEESATIVFWINVISGLSLFVILFFTAEYIADFFHDPRLSTVVRVLGIQLPLAASCSVHSSLLQREFHYKQLFWVRIFTTTTPLLVSVPLALNGAGYWALVAGTLLGQLAQAIVLWKTTHWKPRIWFDKALALELFNFGRWVMLSALLGWFFLWMDALIVGGFLGTHDLGIYRTGNAMVTLVFGLVAGPVIPVLYSLFSRVGNNLSRLRVLVLFVERIVMITVLPLGFGLLVLKNYIPALIFTDKWLGVGEIVGIIGIAQAISFTVSVKQEVYRSIGKPAVETKIMIVSMLIRLPFYLISVHYGIIAFAWARLASTVLGVINHLYFARRFIQMRYRDYFRPLAKILVAAIAMYFAGRVSILLIADQLGLLTSTLIVVSVCVVTYGMLIFMMEASFIRKAFSVINGQNSLGIENGSGQ